MIMSANNYEPQIIEAKWQAFWDKEHTFKTEDEIKVKKSYVLDMFPYPSAQGLHVGHPEGYTATDIYCRYLRMKGVNVLHPMGWDAFGLPAENYAIKIGKHPGEITQQNINNFRRQIKSLGFSYDWSRELSTADPSYYQWTQWLFLKLYAKGLAYQKEAPVNWCRSCQTVLANEQVTNGECERCHSKVEQRQMRQWFFKITAYADELLKDLGQLDWPANIVEMQKNWIGKSEGAEVNFPLVNKKVERFVILHGREGSPDENFIPVLKKGLESLGYIVETPILPDTKNPDDIRQMEYVKKHCNLDSKTVIVGHSFGGIVALRLLEQGIKVNKVILVSTPFTGKFLDNKDRPSVVYACKKGFDFETIIKNADNFVVLGDTKDYVVSIKEAEMFADKLKVKARLVEANEAHFCAVEEPEIFNVCTDVIKIFTTRLDTIFGATYLVLAPEHELVQRLKFRITNWPEVEKYIKKSQTRTELERKAENKKKTGVKLEGLMAINPANKEEIPIFIADYVLTSYGTGAIMAVPAHDERDWGFAQTFGQRIINVIKPVVDPSRFDDYFFGVVSLAVIEGESVEGHNRRILIDKLKAISKGQAGWSGLGLLVNSEEFDGLSSKEAVLKIAKKIGAKLTTQYRLRDWLISRQRYWGAPIPIIHCSKCGAMPVPEKDLPVKLPDDVDFRPTGESPLKRSKSFHQVKCPKCGQEARRESDTMDTFVDSSWYWLRYCDPQNNQEAFNPKKITTWCPVDFYVGGAEHAVLHLLYARFITKTLADLDYIKFREPFLKLRNQGLILGEDGQKMSKSRGNVINPDEIVAKYGADTFRLYEMFMGPLEDSKPWNTSSIIGARRFLDKAWRLVNNLITGQETVNNKAETDLKYWSAYTIKKVTGDIESFNFNTAISTLMEFSNVISSVTAGQEKMKAVKNLLLLLYPFTPHITSELWQRLGEVKYIWQQTWPEWQEKVLIKKKVKIVVQINGKVRDTVDCARGSTQTVVEETVKQSVKVNQYLTGNISKVVYIKDKLINFVVE